MLTIHGNNQRIGVPFQPADEIAAIAVDSVEEGVLEVSRFVQPDNRAVLDNQILKTIQFIAQNHLCSVSHLLSPRISASVPG